MRARPARSGLGVTLAAVTLAAASVLVTTGASAGSNLPDGYPAPACGERPQAPERPQPPERPEQLETDEARAEYNARVTEYNEKAQAYNAEVGAYNASMGRFAACLNEYVANAAADIRLIRKLSREAVDRAGR